MLDDNLKPKPLEVDQSDIVKQLEIELIQKRMVWQQGKARRASFRVLSFLFLFVVLAAALVAFFVFLSSDQRIDLNSKARSAQPTPTPGTLP